MININSREVAVDILLNIMKDGSYSNQELKTMLKKNGAMPKEDRAFVTEIINGTLRNLYYIDYMINKVSSIDTKNMKPYVSAVLRTGYYQIRFMDKVPVSAAVNESVKLIKNKNMGRLSGFVNAVLRKAAELDDSVLPDKNENNIEYLSVKYSHPIWLLKMWKSSMDEKSIEDLCIADNEAPKVCIAVNTLKTSKKELEDSLRSKGIETENGRFCENALYISKTSDISKLEEFKEGKFFVQDESSMISCSAANPKPGEKILDMCSAPGGKSFNLAMLMKNEGEIVSRDIYEHKINLIKDGAHRLGIKIISCELKDAAAEYKEDFNKYDKVIVDAPCSGFGLLRKKPDIRYNRSGEDIDELIKIQRKILEQASKYVKPGGILIYSTCTICRKENTGNMNWFLENFPFEECSLSAADVKNINCSTLDKGYIELLPSIHGTDGFFIAKMRRKDI